MSTFVNPIAPAPTPIPGSSITRAPTIIASPAAAISLCVAKAGRLCDIGRAEPVCVYTAPEGTLYSKTIGLPNSTASAASG